jgi:hypothetical protein
VKLVGSVEPTDYHYLAFFNIVLRTCMEKLGLDLLGRNYYDQKVYITDAVTKGFQQFSLKRTIQCSCFISVR